MPLSASRQKELMADRHRERQPPMETTGYDVVKWGRLRWSLRATPTRGVERWEPVRYLADFLRVCTGARPPRSVALLKGAQLGFTEAALLLVAWGLVEKDWRVLNVGPSGPEASKWGTMRIGPAFERVEELKRLRDANADRKMSGGMNRAFDTGAALSTVGGNTGDRYRSMACDLELLDELDAYPMDLAEGLPFALAQRAVQNTGGLVLAGSTPTSAYGPSQITEAYRAADACFAYVVKCPHCGDLDDLAWERLAFDGEGGIPARARSARMTCGRCGSEWKWSKSRLRRAISGGRWQEAAWPEGAGTDGVPAYPVPLWDGRHVDRRGRLLRGARAQAWPDHAAFALNGLYSIWCGWPAYVDRWLRAQGDAQRLRAFVEQTLAREWQDPEEAALEPSAIRRMALPVREVPDEFRLGVCAVDVQHGWLSVHVWLLGDLGGLLVDRREFEGDTDHVGEGAWAECGRWLATKPQYERRGIRLLAVDTGYRSDVVVQSARRWQFPNLYLVKGVGGWDKPTAKRGKTTVRGVGVRLWSLGVDGLKLEANRGLAAGRYRIADHMPAEVEKELTAERLKRAVAGGRRVRRWVQEGGQNEAFDCLAYALAARAISGIADIGGLPLGAVRRRKRKRMGRIG